MKRTQIIISVVALSVVSIGFLYMHYQISSIDGMLTTCEQVQENYVASNKKKEKPQPSIKKSVELNTKRKHIEYGNDLDEELILTDERMKELGWEATD